MVLVGIGTTIYNCYNGKIMSKFSSTERQTIEALLEKISIECKNEYIINFYIIRDVYSIYVPDIIRKPLHFFLCMFIINFVKTIHCFVYIFLSIIYKCSHLSCIHITVHNQVKQNKSLPSSSSFLSRLIICISVNMSGNLLMMWNRRH